MALMREVDVREIITQALKAQTLIDGCWIARHVDDDRICGCPLTHLIAARVGMDLEAFYGEFSGSISERMANKWLGASIDSCYHFAVSYDNWAATLEGRTATDNQRLRKILVLARQHELVID